MCIQTQDVYDVNMQDAETLARGAYHHGNLKEALIEAGMKALATAEADELSLRMLAREVGVTANAAYRHFADKDDLLNALAAEGFKRFAQSQREAVVGHDAPEERLKASGLAYIAFAMAQPGLYRLMFGRLDHMANHAGLQCNSLDAMSTLLEAAAAQLKVPAHDERVRVAAAACWGLVHGLSALAMGGQLAVFGMNQQDLIERVMALPSLVAQTGTPKEL
jgi:AcrR family transcriptional regulator